MSPACDRPSDCGLALTFPLQRETFLGDVQDPAKDFVRSWADAAASRAEDLWPTYARILDYATAIGVEARQVGVAVEAGATLQTWADLVAARRVVTLVAHWAERDDVDSIEFADGLVSVDAIVKCLPRDYDGVLDLTTCRSTRAIRAIKQACRRCTVLTNREETSLTIRLVLYRQIIRMLKAERTTYVDAATRVHLALEAL